MTNRYGTHMHIMNKKSHKKHKNRHHTITHICSICGWEFKNILDRREHYIKTHIDREPYLKSEHIIKLNTKDEFDDYYENVILQQKPIKETGWQGSGFYVEKSEKNQCFNKLIPLSTEILRLQNCINTINTELCKLCKLELSTKNKKE